MRLKNSDLGVMAMVGDGKMTLLPKEYKWGRLKEKTF